MYIYIYIHIYIWLYMHFVPGTCGHKGRSGKEDLRALGTRIGHGCPGAVMPHCCWGSGEASCDAFGNSARLQELSAVASPCSCWRLWTSSALSNHKHLWLEMYPGSHFLQIASLQVSCHSCVAIIFNPGTRTSKESLYTDYDSTVSICSLLYRPI